MFGSKRHFQIPAHTRTNRLWWQDLKSPALSECLGQSDGAESGTYSPLITSIQIHIARRRPFLPCSQSHENVISSPAVSFRLFLTPPTLFHAQRHFFTLLRVTMTLLTIITRTSRLHHLTLEAGAVSLGLGHLQVDLMIPESLSEQEVSE